MYIHGIFQGKGGAGKSFIATCLAQRLTDKYGHAPVCLDVDPVNATLNAYTALAVQKLPLIKNGRIIPRNFDQLIEVIAGADQHVVFDTGASTFVPLTEYMITQNFPGVLTEFGHELVMHVVIAGGELQDETISNFSQQIAQFPEPTPFVVWQNEHWGPIEHQGKGFKELKAYQRNKNRIASMIRMPKFPVDTYGADISDLIRRKMTFADAINDPDFTIMSRHRLKKVRDRIWSEMDACPLI